MWCRANSLKGGYIIYGLGFRVGVLSGSHPELSQRGVIQPGLVAPWARSPGEQNGKAGI